MISYISSSARIWKSLLFHISRSTSLINLLCLYCFVAELQDVEFVFYLQLDNIKILIFILFPLTKIKPPTFSGRQRITLHFFVYIF